MAEAGWQVAQQTRRHFAGPYEMHIAAVKPDKRRRDLDNLAKPTADFLVHIGIVADDCNAQKISLEWVKDGPPITVTLKEVAA